jgi:hypothetical protein
LLRDRVGDSVAAANQREAGAQRREFRVHQDGVGDEVAFARSNPDEFPSFAQRANLAVEAFERREDMARTRVGRRLGIEFVFLRKKDRGARPDGA